MKYAFYAVAALTSVAGASPAVAEDIYSFTYTTAENIVQTGTLYGSLASDGNHFTVTSNGSFTYNGQTYPVSGPPQSVDVLTGVGNGYNNSGEPVVTVDGSYMDYISNDTTNQFVGFAVNDQYPFSTKQPSFFQNSDYYEPFNVNRFSSSVSSVAAAPEPATWAMMFLGLGVAGYALSRKRKGAVATNVAFA